MLENLVINNIVLIDEANIDFNSGLSVLTGETGSGKSILLDALALAIGVRSNTRLLRNGEKQGSVIATFNLSENNKCRDLLKEQEIDCDDELILRRILTSDGKSKAFVNGIPVTQNFLNQVGEQLIEIHGQHEQRGLLNPSFHRNILDEYGNLKKQREIVENIFVELNDTKNKFIELTNKKDDIEREIDYLEHIIGEIDELDVKEDEEEKLDDKRRKLMNKEKILKLLGNVKNTIDGQTSVSKLLSNAQSHLNRGMAYGDNLLSDGKNAFEDIVDGLEKTSIEFQDTLDKIDSILYNLGYDEMSLNEIEERLFAIRGLARKLNITSDLLPIFRDELQDRLDKYQNQHIEIGDLDKKSKELEKQYLLEANKLREQRKIVAQKLESEILEELKPLKMEKVRFKVDFQALSESQWSKTGIDSIRFLVATNTGTELDDLSKIASGGELSRFMLAFKVVLSKISSVPTLIFDEIDTGVSGAVADAIGERLKKLGKVLQVFTITHLPQVASKGDWHLKIEKQDDGQTTRTIVHTLDKEERKIEIAKMLSNDKVTDEAIKAAEKLLGY